VTQVATSNRLLPTYARLGVTFVEGDGAWLVDDTGKRYLDLFAGIAVVGLGHCHPAPLAAAQAQLERLWHVSNLYWSEPMSELADRLSDRFGGTHAFFCNSGAESVEAALKWARKATGRSEVVALEGSFHGRTFGALSVTGQPSKRAAFEPLVPGARFATPATLAEHVSGDTAAILLEPVQGEGGVHPLPQGVLEEARALADEHGALLILDEVQTGLGRTGRWFGFEDAGVAPDVVTVAKALGNGMPIGACWARAEVAAAFRPGDHATTFGGQPLAASAALAVLTEMQAINAPALARAAGARLTTALAALPGVVAVRGSGLLLAAELAPGYDAAEVTRACLDAGLVVNGVTPTALRLAPPLLVSDSEIDEAVAIIGGVLAERSAEVRA